MRAFLVVLLWVPSAWSATSCGEECFRWRLATLQACVAAYYAVIAPEIAAARCHELELGAPAGCSACPGLARELDVFVRGDGRVVVLSGQELGVGRWVLASFALCAGLVLLLWRRFGRD